MATAALQVGHMTVNAGNRFSVMAPAKSKSKTERQSVKSDETKNYETEGC